MSGPADFRTLTAATVTEAFLSLPEYRRADSISIYLSMPQGEVSTKAIVRDAFQQGKRVFVPYIYKLNHGHNIRPRLVMDMASLHSMDEHERLQPDAWGIPTLEEGSMNGRHRILDEEEIAVHKVTDSKAKAYNQKNKTTEHRKLDLIVMPGVAFDNDLTRLGHGKGFYDHFLERYHIAAISVSGEKGIMPFLGLSA